jgi:hypothetical protein
MGLDALQLHPLGPRLFADTLSAHAAVARASYPSHLFRSQVLNVEHFHRALPHQLLGQLTSHRLPQGELGQQTIACRRHRRPLGVDLSGSLDSVCTQRYFLTLKITDTQQTYTHTHTHTHTRTHTYTCTSQTKGNRQRQIQTHKKTENRRKKKVNNETHFQTRRLASQVAVAVGAPEENARRGEREEFALRWRTRHRETHLAKFGNQNITLRDARNCLSKTLKVFLLFSQRLPMQIPRIYCRSKRNGTERKRVRKWNEILQRMRKPKQNTHTHTHTHTKKQKT